MCEKPKEGVDIDAVLALSCKVLDHLTMTVAACFENIISSMQIRCKTKYLTVSEKSRKHENGGQEMSQQKLGAESHQ